MCWKGNSIASVLNMATSLPDIIEDLKQSHLDRNRHLLLIGNTRLFDDLHWVYESEDRDNALRQSQVHIEKFVGPIEMEKYKKLATVYNRKMYNKFFVPIWAAAMDADRNIGYALYPVLSPLKTVLKDFRHAHPEPSEQWFKVLRLTMAPIALALDALHTKLPRIRSEYTHGDVCLDNVYMCVRIGKDIVEYDDARLMLAGLDKCTNHHPEVRESAVVYSKRHDWYSFGFYILEVLQVLLAPPVDRNVPDYRRYVEQSDLVEGLKCHILQYIDIAKECIELQNQPAMVSEQEVIRRLEPFSSIRKLHFEYPISPWTAQLLWMYEDERPNGYIPYQHMDGEEICQACLLCPTVKAHTKIHEYYEDQPYYCETECQSYCFLCYTNGERLFCTKQHNTTSAVLGNPLHFALVLYGDTEREPTQPNVFENDSNMIANAYKHRLIHGIPEDNICVRRLYDKNGPLTADGVQRLLRDHCLEMHNVIYEANVGKAKCTVLIFYSGHGNYDGTRAPGRQNPDTAGDWCPAFGSDETLVTITKEQIERCWKYIKTGSNGQNRRSPRFAEVSYVLDCCHPVFNVACLETDYSALVRAEQRTEAKHNEEHSEITEWLCLLMRSLYYTKCCSPECTTGGPPCLPGEEAMPNYHQCQITERCRRRGIGSDWKSPCDKITRRIFQRLEGKKVDCFIDGECLIHHRDHPRYETKLHVSLISDYDSFILAYYNRQGVHLKALSFDDNRADFEIPFFLQLVCDKIKEVIRMQILENESLESRIALLTNMTDGHSEYELVTDEKINYIIGSSALFYHVITDPVEVVLEMRRTGKEPVSDSLILDLNQVDLNYMVTLRPASGIKVASESCKATVGQSEIKGDPELPSRKCCFPNLFVYISHQLQYTKPVGGEEDGDRKCLKEGFFRRLVNRGNWQDWSHVESSARNYWLSEDVERFQINDESSPKITIHWEMEQ